MPVMQEITRSPNLEWYRYFLRGKYIPMSKKALYHFADSLPFPPDPLCHHLIDVHIPKVCQIPPFDR